MEKQNLFAFLCVPDDVPTRRPCELAEMLEKYENARFCSICSKPSQTARSPLLRGPPSTRSDRKRQKRHHIRKKIESWKKVSWVRVSGFDWVRLGSDLLDTVQRH